MILSRFILSTLLLSSSFAVYAQKIVFAVLPDTQTYLESCPEVLDKQREWIEERSSSINAVIQLGDLTQDNHSLEWYTIDKFFEALEKKNMRYTFSLGNHDMGSAPRQCADTKNTSLANRYFPVHRFEKNTDWGGSYDNRIDNHYITFEAGGEKWLILSLAFGPSDDVLQWANKVVEKNKDKIVIVNTHAYMYADSTRMGEGDKWLPQHYGIAKDSLATVNNGEQIWEKFVSRHANIIAVLSGHVLDSGVGTLVSEGINKNSVYQMLSNYQRGVDNSQMVKNGYLRLLTFDKGKKELKVETISAVTGEKHPSLHHNFLFANVILDKYTLQK